MDTDFDGAGHDIATSRLVDATPQQVWDAFADPQRLARWWGPAGFRSTFRSFDLHAGGDWLFTLHGPDGTDYPNHSVFVELHTARRVVFDHVNAPHFRFTLTLEAEGGRTRVGWRQRFATAAERDRIATFAEPANEQNLDRLQAELRRTSLTSRTASHN